MQRRPRSCCVAVTAVAAVLWTHLPAAWGDSVQPPAVSRVAGPDRIGTAVELSELAFPEACAEPSPPGPSCPPETPLAAAAVLARADVPAEALLASGLAGHLAAPVLLNPTQRLSDAVRQELLRLRVPRVLLLGGPLALSAEVERELRDGMGLEVQRLAGADRDQTAAAVAAQVPADGAVVVAREATADATAAAALAARLGWPVLPVERDAVPDPIRRALAAQRPEHVVVVGGDRVVSDGVLAQIDAEAGTVERVSGPDRWATSAAVAHLSYKAGLSVSDLWVASGSSGADSLTAGTAAARLGGVLILSPAAPPLHAALTGFVTRFRPLLQTVRFVGGHAALADGVQRQLTELAAPAGRAFQNITYSVSTDRDSYPSGDTVQIIMSLCNVDDSDQTLEHRGTGYIEILDRTGHVVADDRKTARPGVVERFVLAAGECREHTLEWRQQSGDLVEPDRAGPTVGPGTYRVHVRPDVWAPAANIQFPETSSKDFAITGN